MHIFFQKIGQAITRFIAVFYPLFSRWFTPQVFRYGVCGASNMVFDWVLYFIVYNFVLRHKMLHLGFVTLSSHIATLAIVFPITLLTGFFLSKYVTFVQSTLQGGRQLIRYTLVVFINLAINYLGLKVFVDICNFYPTPSKILITLITIAISYFCQKHFTFKR